MECGIPSFVVYIFIFPDVYTFLCFSIHRFGIGMALCEYTRLKVNTHTKSRVEEDRASSVVSAFNKLSLAASYT